VADIHRMLQRLIGEDIDLRTSLSPDLGNVLVDAGQLQQVIMNLAVNSRDAMPDGGALLIETGNITFDGTYVAAHPEVRQGAHVMVAITDTGTGMSPEVKARIFEPFFTTKPQGSGTGLGLATVYGIVKQAGGWIWVYSEPGHGTTFKIYFPRIHEAVSQVQAVPKTDVRGSETILIVEDQAEVRNLAVSALKRLGYTVYSAGSAEEALSFAQAFMGTVHLLLTDVVLGGMNGRILAQQFAQHQPRAQVLFMSGYTDNAIAHHAVLDTGVAYLQKPFRPETLAERIREVLGPGMPSTATVLIVDDEDSVRRFLRHALTSAGYAVLEASNGRQALLQLTVSPAVELVITDLVMPEQEGLETIRELRALRPQLKIIAISGALDGSLLQAVETFGAIKSLPKPIDRDKLLDAVRQALARTAG
jgi:CheY-like chemotaxis protein